MVGDRLDTDILFGHNGGLAATALVLGPFVLTALTPREYFARPHASSYVIAHFEAVGLWVPAWASGAWGLSSSSV